MTEPLNQYKAIIERDFKGIGEPIPQGFAITYNQETQLVKAFLDGDSYARLKETQDDIVSQWDSGKWKDK
jgi:hypothetical protein